MNDKNIRVVYVSKDNYSVALNIGKEDGVQLEEEFIIYTYSDSSLTDPETGEDLGKLEIVRGKGKVTNVQEKLCTVRSTETQFVKRHELTENPYSMIRKPQMVTYDDKEDLPFDNPEHGDYAKRAQ